jgi:hypothetical protein
MHRREFLSLMLLGAGSLVLQPPSRDSAPVYSFKPAGGRILALSEDGRSWDVSLNLGPQFQVLDVRREGEDLIARVSFQGHSFDLKSTDGKRWYTRDWTPPPARQARTLEESHG